MQSFFQVDAVKRHQDKAQWIRITCVAFLAEPDPSRNADLVDEVEVVDERARAQVKDLIQRVETLESVLKPLRPDHLATALPGSTLVSQITGRSNSVVACGHARFASDVAAGCGSLRASVVHSVPLRLARCAPYCMGAGRSPFRAELAS